MIGSIEEKRKNKMTHEKYDCRGICLNLVRDSQSPQITYSFLYGLRPNDKYGYFCSLTNRRCVGAIENSFLIFVRNDEIDSNVVERCPSRKTIDDALKKLEEK
jgi:hypothetical protein